MIMNKRLLASVIISSIIYAPVVFSASSKGFLTAETAPDSLHILPPPPQENTIAFLNDKANYDLGRTLINSERKKLAAIDADYKNISQIFTSAFGEDISPSTTPKLYALLQGVLQDSHDFAMRGAKDHYMRIRPFVLFKNHTCTPQDDEKMAKTGSYPSGHASFGWAAALVLAEINPERETEILKRGYDFGQSRVICGAHWQSDVDNGRLMGAAVIASLHNNHNFNMALNDAKEEFKQTRLKNN